MNYITFNKNIKSLYHLNIIYLKINNWHLLRYNYPCKAIKGLVGFNNDVSRNPFNLISFELLQII